MRKRYLLGAGVAIAMAFSWASAQAQLFVMPSGPGALYFGIEGGWTHLNGAEGRKWDEGFNLGARAGYEWGPLRFEEEFNFATNKLHSWSVPGAVLPVTGLRNRYAIMTNAIYDIPLGWSLFGFGLSPHIGAGIGAVDLHDGVSLRPGSGLFGPTCAQSCTIASSSDWQFGYQGIAGIRYNINPSLAFDLDYRYLATTNPTFKFAPQFGGGKYKSEYTTHNIVASLSVKFGAPPPPAPLPPPPPVVQRQVFLVFFDWDKDTITPEGMRVVQQAADAWRAGGMVTIHVTGYTDASGSAGYNQRLSERRANNVANALTRFGVPRQAMDVSGRGKNDQRVPTADGVREPQNRRVEIVWP